jgi:hypothetical protein
MPFHSSTALEAGKDDSEDLEALKRLVVEMMQIELAEARAAAWEAKTPKLSKDDDLLERLAKIYSRNKELLDQIVSLDGKKATLMVL